MALRIYIPRTHAFAAEGVPDADLSLPDLLLYNILIELKALNAQLSGQAPQFDDLSLIQASLVAEI